MSTNPQYPFTLPNRLLYKKQVNPGDVQALMTKPMLIDEFRTYLNRVVTVRAPKDFRVNPSLLDVSFDKGYMTARVEGVDHLLTTVAASQLASSILPTRFWRGLKDLIHLGPNGAALGTKVWAEFARSHQSYMKDHRFRTIRSRVTESNIQPVLRSVHSLDYSTYGDLEFVDDLMQHAGEFNTMPIVSVHLMDNVMRLRVVALNTVQAVLGSMNPEMISTQPIPMLEAWNSETGCRRTGMRAGLFVLKDNLALGHWDDRAETSWVHRGENGRITRGVRKAMTDSLERAKDVIDAYLRADAITIEDPETWIRNYLKGNITEEMIDTTILTLNGGETLKDAVNAVSKAAQTVTDVLTQEEIERNASKMLAAGIKQAHNNLIGG